MSQSNQKSLDTLTPERHQRGAGGDSIVYPVISRRARGLSLGINLFPDRKVCSYDCPYCEVAPFSNPDARLVDGDVERALQRFFAENWPLFKKEYKLMDISISGNGEPTLSPCLAEALRAAKKVLTKETARDPALSVVPIVLITNSSGFLRMEVADLLADFYTEARFRVWAKLDGGTEELHQALSRSRFSLAEIVRGISAMSRRIPLTMQTMILSDARSGKILFDVAAYALALRDIIAAGGRIEAIQLYTVARHPSEFWVKSLSDDAMREFARQLSAVLASTEGAALDISVQCFGEHSELAWR